MPFHNMLLAQIIWHYGGFTGPVLSLNCSQTIEILLLKNLDDYIGTSGAGPQQPMREASYRSSHATNQR